MKIYLHESDELALQNLLKVRPAWHSNKRARDAIALAETTILHAGPPFESVAEIPQPVLNSAFAAAVFEGIASDFQEAKELVLNKTIRFESAQDHGVVVPLAAVVSPSMWLHEVIDSENSKAPRAYTPFNGGNGPAMRLGLCNNDVVEHFRWINSDLAGALQDSQPKNLPLIPIAASSLHRGDDCHGRTIAATQILIEHLQPGIRQYPEALEFLLEGPSFFLNLWMAACKCMLLSASNVPKSSVITAAAGNGYKVGFQVSAQPGTWITCPAAVPLGDLGKFHESRALGAIGDSAVVDLLGLGAMAVSFAPEQQKIFRAYLPEDATKLPAQLLPCVHDEFGSLNIRTGLCVRQIIAQQTTPVVSLGIIDNKGKAGRLGGGIYRYPLELFSDAVLP